MFRDMLNDISRAYATVHPDANDICQRLLMRPGTAEDPDQPVAWSHDHRYRSHRCPRPAPPVRRGRRLLRGRPRRRPGRADRHHQRTPRHQRRGQDLDPRGDRGPGPAQRRVGAGARPRPGRRPPGGTPADRRTAAAQRLLRRPDRGRDAADVGRHGHRPAAGRRGADHAAARAPRRHPGAGAVGRRAAPARPRLHADGRSRGGAARRADHRARPREPPRRLEPDPRAARPRRDRAAHHALPRGGRGAGRPGRHHARGPDRQVRDAGRDLRRPPVDDPLRDPGGGAAGPPPCPRGRGRRRPDRDRDRRPAGHPHRAARLGRTARRTAVASWRPAPPASSRSSSTSPATPLPPPNRKERSDDRPVPAPARRAWRSTTRCC